MDLIEMSPRPLFSGLIFDENGQPVEVAYVGQDPCYVVDENGFKRHILTETVDRQVLDHMQEMVEGHEDIISEQATKMMGQDDLFTRAIILNQLKQMDQQFDKLLESGLPEEVRSYMGMMGFKIIIDLHGQVIDVQQPGMIDEGDSE